jgi:hypothetical protein
MLFLKYFPLFPLHLKQVPLLLRANEESYNAYLESPHISWVSRILEAVLVAFEKEFQEKPARIRK